MNIIDIALHHACAPMSLPRDIDAASPCAPAPRLIRVAHTRISSGDMGFSAVKAISLAERIIVANRWCAPAAGRCRRKIYRAGIGGIK